MSTPNAETSHPGEDGGSYAEWVGRIVEGRYRIDGLLGEGGMGAVFEAEDQKLMKKVALKVIHPEFAGDGEVAKRFAREAMASAQMEHHPHVASASDYGTLAEGGAYLVMQYVRGDSLRRVLDEEGAIGWIRACEVGAQIADALSAAHKLKIVHRDLKPDNVMLEPRDDGSRMVKVLDFGIARVADERIAASGQNLTRVGTVIGTPGYMAPEQALGENIDLRADLYALGLLIYEMTTGERVFDVDDLTAIVTRQLTEDAPRISASAAGVPAELDDLVASMLTKDRDARPESAAVVRDTLRNLLLGATLQKVASGEHVIPLGTTELAGSTSRDPTPLGIPLQRVEAETPPAVAPTMMSGKVTIPTPVRKVAAAATARTALALGQVKRDAEKAGVPVKPIGIGCGVVAGLLFLGLVISAIFGDDSAMQKHEHRRPEVHEPGSETGPTPEEVTERAAETMPSELAQPMADLLISDSDRVRSRAARTVLAYEPRDEVPELAVALAELERATSCANKKEQLERLVEIGDPQALPALERIDAAPRNGCRRMFRRFDCYGCMRDELAQAIETLRSEM